MRLVAFDVETRLIRPGLLAPKLVCVSFAWRESLGSIDSIVHDAQSGVDVFRAMLLDPGTTLLAHNTAFDVAVLCAEDPTLIPLVFQAYADGRFKDTKIRQELLDIATGRMQKNGSLLVFRNGEWVAPDYSLAGNPEKPGTKGLVGLHLNKDRSAQKGGDSWRLRYGSLEHLPIEEWPEDAVSYSIEDSVDALEVFEEQGGLEREVPTEDDQVRAHWALHLMSCWGVRTDPVMVPELKAKLLAERERNRKILIKVQFLKPDKCTAEEIEKGKVDWTEQVVKRKQLTKKEAAADPPGLVWDVHPKTGKEQAYLETVHQVHFRWAKDTKRIQEYVRRVYERRKQPVPMTAGRVNKATGKRVPEVATDKDTLYQSRSRLLKVVADGGGVDKLLDTYVPALEQGTKVPVNARFNVLVNSGRTSCAEPNLQNLPTGRRVGGVRECFVPREGFWYVSTDYSTQELRSLAEVCYRLFGWSKMRDAINAGKDLHVDLAADILGLTYEEALARYKAGDKELKKTRDAAKAGNFGLPGGLGEQSFVEYARATYGVTLTLPQAKELKAQWLRKWPEMKLYFAFINAKVGFGDGATLVHPITGFVRGLVGYTDGCNHLFQHLAALGAKRALFQVAWECYVDKGTALYGSRPVAFIHDEIVAEVPAGKRAHDASLRLVKVMEEAQTTCHQYVVQKAEPALMKRWWKNAKDVWTEDGTLVPWEPELKSAA